MRSLAIMRAVCAVDDIIILLRTVCALAFTEAATRAGLAMNVRRETNVPSVRGGVPSYHVGAVWQGRMVDVERIW